MSSPSIGGLHQGGNVKRESLNAPQFPSPNDHIYDPSAYNNYSAGLDPQLQQPPTLLSQRDDHSVPQDHSRSSSYGNYPVYSSAEETGIAVSGIDPNELLMGSRNNSQSSHPTSHHSTPSLQILPHQQSPGQQQPGSATFLSSSSTNPSGGFDWEPVFAQQQAWTHHRTPSEYSEISSASASPYLQNQEFSDHPSPLLHGQGQPGSMQEFLHGSNSEAFGLEGFTLADHDLSPRVSPQPGQGLPSEQNSPYLVPQNNYLGLIPPMAALGHGTLGQNPGSMAPPPAGHGASRALAGLGVKTEEDPSFAPEINVTFAPPQRQPTFPGKPGLNHDDQALSPPPKSGPGRKRAVSDTGPITRPLPSSPGSTSPVGGRSRRNSLSPIDVVTAPVGSPASNAAKRRGSTNSVPNRDYILELAHPNRPGATVGDSKRVQKHPATFQCHLCPKRFTRAYNLRSHLRTHTDERPFVCTICGKAFARQHDRKRHEGLHSGEKKFVCKGNLKAGGTWGCGRRFARADALGRHFRSEAGRVCIRPLLDEETAERQRNSQMHQQGQILDPNMAQIPHAPPDLSTAALGAAAGGLDASSMGMAFPSALLEQYPALANMEWGAIGDGGGDDIDGSRSDFDNSANEWEEGSLSGGGSGLGSHRNSYDGSQGHWSGDGWASDDGAYQAR